ncbi:MAG: prepilin-type N-terminal cleavage/methylation domain-containing protein [bacterium]|jgi:prepilin-type N-terminal cleavage/methylation domain-containing protein
MKMKAFTLIELLVVVAIISILASIALPNFQHAQVKAKSAAAMAEMRTLVTAIESYSMDNNRYPLDGNDFFQIDEELFDQQRIQKVLTTPTAYISEIPEDLFHQDASQHTYDPVIDRYFQSRRPYPYVYFSKGNFKQHRGTPHGYFLFSFGPDRIFDNAYHQEDEYVIYDPTNGIISGGDILTKGP